MRTTLGAFLITLGFAVSASAQSPPLLRVDITDGAFRAGMAPMRMSYVMGGPWAAIPSKGVKADVEPTVTDFRIRTWFEGEGVRVAVFAVTRSAAREIGVVRVDEREEQITSVFLGAGQSVEITTDKYNARPITVRAVDRSTEPVDVRALVEEARRLRTLVSQPR